MQERTPPSRREFLRSRHWGHEPQLRLLSVRDDSGPLSPLSLDQLVIKKWRESMGWFGLS